MGQDTKIQWAHHTFNPWIGCTKVSPGCANCYAESQDKRWGYTDGGWGAGKPRKRTSESNWRKPIQWNKAATDQGIRQRVFCASLADWLDHEVDPQWRIDLLDLIQATPSLDWLLLSKRPEEWLGAISKAAIANTLAADWLAGDAPENVWVGFSAEDQQRYDERMKYVVNIPATVTFCSAEPMLGPLTNIHGTLDWLIVGGESGQAPRAMKPEWLIQTKSACDARPDVSFFFKQWGGSDKDKGGRLFGGRTWDELPR